ncbi:ribosome small subunit-dependent GTPase A [Crenothrix sp.]|uniref:ribosome small subunit-dependent GTPase A n=1 Tax=Crenothrix sp. TaxID=3100433 RepID=UPI00374D1BF4
MTHNEGLVIAHLGQGIAVEYDNQIILCQTVRRLDTVAVGDRVLWSRASEDQGRIEEILPRRSVLVRPSKSAKSRPVAANIDTIFVVFAVEPRCDFLLLDQYLAICENRNIDAALVLNKTDLPLSDIIEQELRVYEDLGYALYRVSAASGSGMEALKQALKGQVSLFAGQSGVGKSSLTNAILPDKLLKTNTVSATTKHGRHTTTAATLYHLPDGGDLIDSPGVAIFGLAELSDAQLAYGYREFQALMDECQFNDCSHTHDKGCAILPAVENGTLSISRYQRFLKLKEKM